MANKRMFEFVVGTSNKFWEIWSDGNEVRTRYGKIGTAGQVTVNAESSSADAKKRYTKLIGEKTKKGYIEVTGAPRSTAAGADEAVEPMSRKKAKKAPAKKAKAKSSSSSEPEIPDAALVAMASELGIRPATNPPHWGYEFVVEEHAPDRDQLRSFFGRIKRLKEGHGMANYIIIGADTPAAMQHAAWNKSCVMLRTEQLRPHLPPADDEARLARLRALLSAPPEHNNRSWFEIQMLLTSWRPETLAVAVDVVANGLSSWPDELRSGLSKRGEQPALDPLFRCFWGKLAEGLDNGALAAATVIATDDHEGLLAHHRDLAHVKQLSLHGKPGAADVVAQLTGMTGLEVLILNHPSYSAGPAPLDLGPLLGARHLAGLKGLSTYGLTLSGASLQHLADAEQPFEHLKLQYAKMTAKSGGSALAKLSKRRQLKTLDVKYNDLGPKGAEALFAGGDFSALRVLDISANEIGDRGVAAMTSSSLTELRWLNLSSNANKEQLTAAAAQGLAACRSLGNLKTLIVMGHPIESEGLAAILSSSSLRSLEGLGAYSCGSKLSALLKDCGADAPPLRKLDISGQAHGGKPDWTRATFLKQATNLKIESLDGKDYAGLFSCPHLDNVEVLNLGGCYSNPDEGFEALINTTPPPALRILNLVGWKLTQDQARAFVTSSLGRQLHGVELMASYTSKEAWTVFHQAGLPLVTSACYDGNPTSEYFTSTTFRQEL
ncbi:MAG: WGR domain-containing protein [Deltaproteobacteria bacterium]|nr:WGR domain-containing protein [Deltaproteobacteria bacterium]